LNDFRSLEDMRSMADRAQRMPSFEASFRNLYLNQRIDSTTPFIARAEWMACKGQANLIEPGEPVYLALDLSGTTDLTALAAVSAGDDDRVEAWHWKPGALIDEHERRDRAPYGKWIAEGWLNAPPGRAIDYGYVASQIAELVAQYDVMGLAYDRWRIELLLREFAAIGVDCYVEGKDKTNQSGLRLIPWGQGYKDMTPAVEAIENSIVRRTFTHPGNPLLTYCFANAIATQDPAGNRKLDKSATRFRIDGAVATTMAIGLKYRDAGDNRLKDSVYEERGLLAI